MGLASKLAAFAARLTSDSKVPQAALAANVAGTGPAFSAYLASSGGSFGSGAFTKCLFDTELWDTNNNFASSRFTPTVAGYYQINAGQQMSPVGSGLLSIFKNGSEYKRGVWPVGAFQNFAVNAVVYLNGSTDFVEVYLYHTSGVSTTPQGGASVAYFDGTLIRAA